MELILNNAEIPGDGEVSHWSVLFVELIVSVQIRPGSVTTPSHSHYLWHTLPRLSFVDCLYISVDLAGLQLTGKYASHLYSVRSGSRPCLLQYSMCKVEKNMFAVFVGWSDDWLRMIWLIEKHQINLKLNRNADLVWRLVSLAVLVDGQIISVDVYCSVQTAWSLWKQQQIISCRFCPLDVWEWTTAVSVSVLEEADPPAESTHNQIELRKSHQGNRFTGSLKLFTGTEV